MQRSMTAIILAFSVAVSGSAFGQSGAPEDKPMYSPGLGEFMLLVQTHHLKLWLAGQAGNWKLADHQAEELKEVLEDTAKLIPVYKEIPVGSMIGSIIVAPIEGVEKAIKARSRSDFITAFDKLTGACNDCHNAANRPYIVIQRPTGAQFPNQSFAPKSR